MIAKPEGWTPNVELAKASLLRLTPRELSALQQWITETFGEGPEAPDIGIREPRRPKPPRPSSAVELELPGDDVGSGLSASS